MQDRVGMEVNKFDMIIVQQIYEKYERLGGQIHETKIEK